MGDNYMQVAVKCPCMYGCVFNQTSCPGPEKSEIRETQTARAKTNGQKREICLHSSGLQFLIFKTRPASGFIADE